MIGEESGKCHFLTKVIYDTNTVSPTNGFNNGHDRDPTREESPTSPTRSFEESVDSLIRDIRLSRSLSAHSICCLESPISQWIGSSETDGANAEDLLYSHTTVSSDFTTDSESDDRESFSPPYMINGNIEEDPLLEVTSFSNDLEPENKLTDLLYNSSNILGTIEEKDAESDNVDDKISGTSDLEPDEIELEILVARSPSRSKSDDTNSLKAAEICHKDQPKTSDDSSCSSSLSSSDNVCAMCCMYAVRGQVMLGGCMYNTK